ncbi:P pilus assembly protein, chaperone PapD [Izhakiella capsodis]|uniref:P pilus assembly protein, chaperone PapD n=1 Tax=Izhakiella capsodis TaxID=1367852 RepID=A0A1I4XFC6_9GAMM|nr:molecular chaperone [Izhakiella capsodis]SFN24465.1 P pilus assembly protein, chaperone PapD [Izhakiella capsodis]
MKNWRIAALAVVLTTFCTMVKAGVVVGGTRLIYDGTKKESSINVSNPDKNVYLIQSWVDSAEAGAGVQASRPPFIVTPPLFRLGGNQQNILRVIRAGGDLPENKESLFWLNIKSIPSVDKTQQNTLQIAVKTRIKLIFRPAGVTSTLEDTAKLLTWKRVGNQLQVTNSSPHYFTFFKVKINGTEVKGASMVAPQSVASFDLPSNVARGSLTWQFINDYGGLSNVLTSSI